MYEWLFFWNNVHPCELNVYSITVNRLVVLKGPFKLFKQKRGNVFKRCVSIRNAMLIKINNPSHLTISVYLNT